MSLRAGNTLYFRVIDNQREFWVVDGYTLHDNDMAWKVKRDRTSGRFFFVNLGIHGKKWRLPDIYDPRFGEETLFPRAHHRHNNSTGGDGNNNNNNSSQHLLYGGEFTSPGTPPPFFGGADGHSGGHKRVASGAAGAGGAAAGLVDDKDSPFATFDYGGDLLSSSPLRKVEREKQREADEARRAEERRQEEMLMRSGGGGFGHPRHMNNNNANHSFGSRSSGHHFHHQSLPRHQELEMQMETETARHAAEVHRHVSDTKRLEESLSRQRERNDELLGKEMELTSELEKQQLANIEEHALAVRAHVESLRSLHRTPSPAAGAAVSAVSPAAGGGDGDDVPGANGSDTPRAATPGRSTSTPNMVVTHHPQPSSQHVSFASAASHSPSVMSHGGGGGGPAVMLTTGTVDAAAILQEQLEIERKRNEELRRQIIERDRIILGTQLSEVERERRDMNLRLRCLEAMAAFRRRQGVSDADRGRDRHLALRSEPL